MQNLAGRFHIFEGPALKPHAAVGEIVMEPDELAVFPEFRDEIAVLRLGLELHAVAYRLFGRLGASSAIGCNIAVSCLFPEPKRQPDNSRHKANPTAYARIAPLRKMPRTPCGTMNKVRIQA